MNMLQSLAMYMLVAASAAIVARHSGASILLATLIGYAAGKFTLWAVVALGGKGLDDDG